MNCTPEKITTCSPCESRRRLNRKNNSVIVQPRRFGKRESTAQTKKKLSKLPHAAWSTNITKSTRYSRRLLSPAHSSSRTMRHGAISPSLHHEPAQRRAPDHRQHRTEDADPDDLLEQGQPDCGTRQPADVDRDRHVHQPLERQPAGDLL